MSRFCSLFVLVVTGSLLSACATSTPPPRPVAEPTQRQKEEELARLRLRLLEKDAQIQGLTQKKEEELAKLRLLLLEKDAQIQGLTQKLDAAILEVVRAMAKLQGREGKAEAASSLAEAEIALKLLEKDGVVREKDSNFIQAKQLLKTAAQEFQKENYGGAIYLTSQAKSLVKGEEARMTSREKMLKIQGEVLFSLPLPRVLSKGNIREGPGLNFKVLFVVEEGAPLTGQSYKGLWVRVKSEDGRSGWIFYNLVSQR
jgi:hypothetical protein